MELFNHAFGNFAVGVFDNVIDATKMIGRFDDVVDFDAVIFFEDADGVRLVDIAGLVLGETTAFDMIRVIGEVDLDFVVNAAFCAELVLAAEDLEEGEVLAPRRSLWFVAVARDKPYAALVLRAFYPAGSTIFTHGALRDTPFV